MLHSASDDLCQTIFSLSNFSAKHGDKHRSQEMLPLRGKLFLIYHLLLVQDGDPTLAMFATHQGIVMRRPSFSQLFLLS